MGKGLTYSIVCLVVIVLVITTVSIPIINEATSDTVISIDNKDNVLYYLEEPEDTIKISNISNQPYLNDVKLQTLFGTTFYNGYIFIISDCCYAATKLDTANQWEAWNVGFVTGGTQSTTYLSGNTSYYEWANGTCSKVVNGSVDSTASYTYLYVPTVEETDFASFAPSTDNPIYIGSDETVYFASGNYPYFALGNGTLDDMSYAMAFNGTNDYRASAITVTYTSSENYDTITGITTNPAALYNGASNYYGFFAPVVAYESITHNPLNIGAIIPVLLIVATMILAIHLIKGRD